MTPGSLPVALVMDVEVSFKLWFTAVLIIFRPAIRAKTIADKIIMYSNVLCPFILRISHLYYFLGILTPGSGES